MSTAVHNRPTLGGRLFLLVFFAVISFAGRPHTFA